MLKGLERGVRCKACDKPIRSDPELCHVCLQAVLSLIRDLDYPDAAHVVVQSGGESVGVRKELEFAAEHGMAVMKLK